MIRLRVVISKSRAISVWFRLKTPAANDQRLGHISKQGSAILRFFLHLAMRRGRKIAKLAMARRLAVHSFWMWCKQWDYQQLKQFGPHPGKPGTGVGVH